MAMPRSSHGQYVRPDLIVCRPPKLNDIGLYEVTIAVNGIDFCSDVHVVDIYQDPILNGLIAPQIYNAKMESGLATLILVFNIYLTIYLTIYQTIYLIIFCFYY